MILTRLLPHTLAASALLLLALYIGWMVGRAGSSWPVRLVGAWVNVVAVRVLRSASWTVRSGAIFINNAAILALTVAVGAWSLGAVTAIALIGLSLGIALRVLSRLPEAMNLAQVNGDLARRRRVRIGLSLNMLEPPAIAITIGLSLARTSLDLTPALSWRVFATFVLPLLLVAAVGEALWIGALRNGEPGNHPAVP